MSYANYLRSEKWKQRRILAYVRADFCCEFCGAEGQVPEWPTNDLRPARLHVHHVNYDRLGEELHGDLIVLCASCHQDAHESPKRLDEIAAFAARRCTVSPQEAVA